MSPINRYDTPAQAQFINTYVPIPFDQMMKVGLMKQQMVEQNDTISGDMLASLGSTKVAKPDEPGYLSWRNERQKDLDRILDENPAGSYAAKRELLRLRTRIASDPYYRAVVQNYEPYTKAYSELQEKGAEYGMDSAAVYARAKQLNEFGTAGTKGLMEKTGSGIFQPVGIGPNEKLKPEVESYINDVASESWGKDYVDASGKYIVGETGQGISYERLGAPLGVQFEQYTSGGKKMLRLATDKNGETDLSKVSVPSDIFKTKAGQTLKDEAAMIADRSGGKITYDEALKKRYLDSAYRAIQERVSQSSKMTLQADPYGKSAWDKRLEDQKIVYNVPVLISEKGDTTLSSIDNITTAKDALTDNIQNIQARIDNYVQTYGGGGSDTVDSEGRNVSSVLSEFAAEKEQEAAKLADLDKTLEDVKRDLKIPINWRVSDDFTPEQIADIKKEAAAVADKLVATPMGGKVDDDKWKKQYDYQVNKKMAEGSRYYGMIDKALEENSKTKLVEAGVTTIPTKTANETITNLVYQLTNEGEGKANRLGGAGMAITDAKSGELYTDEDYEKIDRTGKYKPEVVGLAYSQNRGWPQLYTRFYNSKGELMKPALVDAPDGVEDLYIQAGKLSAAEVMLQREFAAASSAASQTGALRTPTTVILGDKNAGDLPGDKVDLRVFKQSRQANMPGGDKYELTFVNPQSGEKFVVNSDTRDEAISTYINYKVALFNYRKTNNFDVSGIQ